MADPEILDLSKPPVHMDVVPDVLAEALGEPPIMVIYIEPAVADSAGFLDSMLLRCGTIVTSLDGKLLDMLVHSDVDNDGNMVAEPEPFLLTAAATVDESIIFRYVSVPDKALSVVIESICVALDRDELPVYALALWVLMRLFNRDC